MTTNGDERKAVSLSMAALHKHWITADAVKARMNLEIKAPEDEMPEELVSAAQKMVPDTDDGRVLCALLCRDRRVSRTRVKK